MIFGKSDIFVFYWMVIISKPPSPILCNYDDEFVILFFVNLDKLNASEILFQLNLFDL